MKTVKPIIPYFGGKSRKLKLLLPMFPERYEAYFEPFFGGGSVGLNVPTNKARHFNDLNPDLMNMYKQIRSEPEEVIRLVTHILGDQDTKHYNEAQSVEYNRLLGTKFEDKVLEAARYLFLVKSSYGGETSHNMHFGHRWKDPVRRRGWSETKQHTIRVASEVLKGARLTCRSYELLKPKQGDFVFADPPYVQAAMKYLVEWREADHFKLFNWLEMLSEYGVKVLITYDDHPLIHKLYQHWNITVTEYYKKTNSNNQSVNTLIGELIIRNY